VRPTAVTASWQERNTTVLLLQLSARFLGRLSLESPLNIVVTLLFIAFMNLGTYYLCNFILGDMLFSLAFAIESLGEPDY
jgi:hypothetical protein